MALKGDRSLVLKLFRGHAEGVDGKNSPHAHPVPGRDPHYRISCSLKSLKLRDGQPPGSWACVHI